MRAPILAVGDGALGFWNADGHGDDGYDDGHCRPSEVNMRKKPISFREEVTQRFQFLDQCGFDGPEYTDELLPSVRYDGSELAISVFLHNDSRDSAGIRISVSIQIDTADGAATADLGELVEAAVFAPRHRVAAKAHTGEAMRATLDDNATWIRRLLPILRGLGALDVVRAATRRQTDSRGNPKRRPTNIKWKYS